MQYKHCGSTTEGLRCLCVPIRCAHIDDFTMARMRVTCVTKDQIQGHNHNLSRPTCPVPPSPTHKDPNNGRGRAEEGLTKPNWSGQRADKWDKGGQERTKGGHMANTELTQSRQVWNRLLLRVFGVAELDCVPMKNCVVVFLHHLQTECLGQNWTQW